MCNIAVCDDSALDRKYLIERILRIAANQELCILKTYGEYFFIYTWDVSDGQKTNFGLNGQVIKNKELEQILNNLSKEGEVMELSFSEEQVLIFVGVNETEGDRKRLEFLEDMFLPINHQMFLFWEHHFGIMDIDDTMEMDEIVLF